ncbi:MAG TPA: TorF family putative porin [Steroidobacteraceae bacterium]|nr:TorF family putative porin [Steroidobacteraceae bacterium]
MKSIKTLALVTGLLAVSGVSQAQFSSTWTAVSDYDFRGFSQSAKDPALQGSADYAFANGLSIGAWASNVDFEPADGDLELDVYLNYAAEINDTFSFTTGLTYYMYPGSDDLGEYPEIYVGFNAGSFSFKQWYADSLYDSDVSGLYSEANYTASINDSFSLAFHAGYAWGDAWDAEEVVDYAVQANYVAGKFTIFGKFTGTDASEANEYTSDVNNNEPRFLVGVMTTFPWGE